MSTKIARFVRSGPNSYSFHDKDRESLQHFLADHGILIPARDITKWRMCRPDPGSIRGLPHLGGCIVRATDGLYCFVELHEEEHAVIKISATNYIGNFGPAVRAGTPIKQAFGGRDDTDKNGDEKKQKGPVFKDMSDVVESVNRLTALLEAASEQA